MNKTLYIICSIMLAMMSLVSCSETETYAEQKEREESSISRYIVKYGINAISEDQFRAQGETTSVEKNEYVFFKSTGIYMQIINKGCGEKLKNNESAEVLCRFKEYNINGDSLQLTNSDSFYTATAVDKMAVRNTSGTFSASFIYGIMLNQYRSAQVPAGWLVPLTYINIGRPKSADEEIAHVKIIVPHDKGQAYATTNVYACEYDIHYMRAE
ncbi:MAG: DUF4827 domain-containing protein [Prevotellaceae bacterium]|nr:DUF4827 domain-containing protein [Prevotellaceae bacterium]MDO4931080.1 DUF4827 domain-containing protein [Prevotellaceae bacterium]